jgi:nitroimidazol reductase NimA-like FMN-containing flavoprotein (pyridoxamine 5'-phosphate oxidase superfamily)|tara:strand:+ start:212 stop:673 length:462 start_codon:yes stop_codon:yes gene_type:complete
VNGYDLMKNTVASLLSQQVQFVLATLSDQGVALHLMAYAFSKDLSEIYLASLENTQKVKNIRNNPSVTCLWDNRTGNHSDHVGGQAMSGFGQARELTGGAEKPAHRLLLERNSTLKDLMTAPDVVFFAVHIDRYQWVEGYTQAMTFVPRATVD